MGRWLLGLGLDDYRQACCLFQAAVGPVAHSEGLVGALRAAIEKGAPDGGVEDADRLLKTFLSSRLGVHTRWYTPLREGSLAQVEGELERATAALQEAEAAREEVRELSVAQIAAERELTGLKDELLIAKQRVLLTDASELGRRVEEVRRQQDRAAQAPERPVTIPQHLREQIGSLRAQLAAEQQKASELEASAQASAADIAALEQRRREHSLERDRLGAYAEWNVEHEDAIRALDAQRKALAQNGAETAEPAPSRDPLLTRYRGERDTLHALTRQRDGQTSWRRSLVAAATAVAAASLIGAILTPVALVGLIIAAAILFAAREQAPPADELTAALRSYGADSLEELDRRVQDEDRLVANAEGRRQERERQAQERQEAHGRVDQTMREALARAGKTPNGDLGGEVAGYLAGCEKHARYVDMEAAVAACSAELMRLREPLRDLDNRRQGARHARARTARRIRPRRSAGGHPGGRRAAYAELISQAAADDEAIADVRNAQEALGALLDGRPADELLTRAEEAAARLREHIAHHGELVKEAGDRTELTARIDELHHRIEQLAGECAALVTRIAEREQVTGDPATLKEEIGQLAERKAKMLRAGHAIRIARERLAEAARAAHRAFAPHLNNALENDLPRLTGGRYAEAAVGEQMEIKIVAPETGMLVPIEELSRGTQDQIALVERLAVARLLDPTTGAAPLLFDDPFAHIDSVRRGYALELIAELAASRQIILTTDDRALVHQAGQLCPDVHYIELTAPPGGDGGSRASAEESQGQRAAGGALPV